jgi:hypothetical protein
MKTLFVYVLTTLTVFGELPPDWKNVQQFEITQPGLIKLGLSMDTLDAAQPGLEDLRIFDNAGREVPYLIERPVSNPVILRGAKEFRVSIDGRTTVLNIETGVAQPIEGLTLETPAAFFIKAVTVEGSTDQQNWQAIAGGQPIFRQANGASQLRVGFGAGVWPFLRVTVDDRRAEAIPFTGARLHAVAGEPAPVEPSPVTVTDRTEDGQTRLTLDLGAAHVTLASLRFETAEPLFTRSVGFVVRQVAENAVTERELARDTVFRMDVEGVQTTERMEVPLDLTIQGRELLVLIDNGDSQPLQISAVRAMRRPVFVVFLAQQSGMYQVVTGNPRCTAPRYDVAVLAPRLKGAAVSPVKLSALAANPSYRPAEPLPEIQDLGTALDTVEWGYRKPVKLARVGVQQLDLDLDVLARADAAFRDLRLVRDGKQRPYILERTSISRKLLPEVSSANDPKRPKVSRWRIKLPYINLPITRLTCTSGSSLFRRQVALYEQPTDDRGERYDRHLGEATWVRTPPATKAVLELVLSARPMTDTLILEMDNGDNPPIELANIQLFHPVTRVLFKAPLEPATYLYYGNREVGVPQYDLDLIAPRLLAEEKSVALLSGEETLKKSVGGELFQLSSTKSIIFWVALAVVVSMLLVVIARLLPKNPQGNSQK